MIRFSIAALAAAVATAFAAAPASATTLVTDGGFEFDVQDGLGGTPASDGSIGSGTAGAYSRCYSLRVNGADYVATPGTSTLAGRFIQMEAVPFSGGIQVERQIYVPASGGDYVRYLDVVTNTSDVEVSVSMSYRGSLGSGASTRVWGSHSGDTVVDLSDFWFGTDDTDGADRPTLAHVFYGNAAAQRPDTQATAMGSITAAYSFDVPPGERVSLLVFGYQGPNQTTVQGQVTGLFSSIESITSDIPEDLLGTVINWRLAGAPLLSWADGQQFEVYEGSELAMRVVVNDREGDATTTVWDLDGDGEYNDADGESASVSAMGLDGPTVLRVGAETTDAGGLWSRLLADITVNNAPPVFVTAAPTAAAVGYEWSYTPVAEDPGGDDVDIELLEGPDGMSMGVGGVLTWLATVEDVGTATLRLSATDDDGGVSVEDAEIRVGEGEPIGEPVIQSPSRGEVLGEARPTIRVVHPEDVNGGLEIFFELDSQNTFPAPMTTGAVVAGGILSDGTLYMPVEPDGTTTWTVDEDLDNGQYFVRVWASDIFGDGPRVLSHFWIEVDEGGDADGDGDGEGCNCRASASEASDVGVLGAMAFAFGWAVLRTRRRRASRHR